MYSCLPWELRHHIHTFCVQGPYDNEVIVRRATGNMSVLLIRQSTGTHSYQWVEDPVLLQLSPDRLGPDLARELLETYYRTRTFKFVHEQLGTVSSFLKGDKFWLAMRPADHVRRVQMQIAPFRNAQLRMPNLKDEDEVRCHQALVSLGDLQHPRSNVDIRVDLAQGFVDEEEYEDLLNDAAGFLFRVVKQLNILKMHGLNVDLTFEGKWDAREGTKLCSNSVGSLDECISKMRIACQ